MKTQTAPHIESIANQLRGMHLDPFDNVYRPTDRSDVYVFGQPIALILPQEKLKLPQHESEDILLIDSQAVFVPDVGKRHGVVVTRGLSDSYRVPPEGPITLSRHYADRGTQVRPVTTRQVYMFPRDPPCRISMFRAFLPSEHIIAQYLGSHHSE